MGFQKLPLLFLLTEIARPCWRFHKKISLDQTSEVTAGTNERCYTFFSRLLRKF